MEIPEEWCASTGCMNYSAEGYIYCELCLHGPPSVMSRDDQRRKKEIEALFEDARVAAKAGRLAHSAATGRT